MRQLYVMDPPEVLDLAGDSTYALMCESTLRGHEVSWCHPRDLYAQDGRGHARVVPTEARWEDPHWSFGEPEDRPLSSFDLVWMRKDPPFDMHYIFATYLLDMAGAEVLVLNEPRGLKLFNEKLWAMQFADLHPPTLLSSDMSRLRAFAKAEPGRVVLKPWDGNGGRGVVVTEGTDRNLGSLVEILTNQGTDAVIAQRYLPEIAKGDKRILLIDGEPAGSILRVPGEGDHRGNMHVGARVESSTLDEREQLICDRLRPHLKEWGMMFVGIDVIGGFLTEINITSPTGIQEINRLDRVKLEARLIDAAQERLEARRGS